MKPFTLKLRGRWPGLTLLELLVVIGIMSVLGTLGLPMGLNGLRYYSLNAEQNVLVGLLENVRSQAIVNTDEIAHGLGITADEYIIFSGASFATRNPTRDIVYPRGNNIIITGGTEVVFSPLTGNTTSTTLNMQNLTSQATISINNEGAINW